MALLRSHNIKYVQIQIEQIVLKHLSTKLNLSRTSLQYLNDIEHDYKYCYQ